MYISRVKSTFSRVALGTMNFGKRTPEAEALSIISAALERGITLFDTANAYTDGASETITGKALGRVRDRVQIATKVGFGRNPGKPEGLSRARLFAAIDESLKRLSTDYVDIYYLHVPDRSTPIEETLDAMHSLLESKKVRAWGVSNYASWEILEMMHIADARNMPRPVISQQLYNMVIRQLDIEYFRFAQKFELHTTVYNPLAAGALSGKATAHADVLKGKRFANNAMYQRRYGAESMYERITDLTQLANEAGIPLLDLAYAWVAGRPGVDSILVGPGTLSHLTDALRGIEIKLTPELNRSIDVLYQKWDGTDVKYAR